MDKTLSPANQLMMPHAEAAQAAERPAVSAREPGMIAFALTWLFVFVAFARPEDIYKPIGALHLTLTLGICASVAFLWGLMTHRVRFEKSRELLCVVLLTCWFCLGVPFAFWHHGSYDLLSQIWVRTFLFFLLLTQTLTTVSRIRKILWAVILSELVASVASLLMQGNPALQVGGRFVGVNQGLLGWNFLGITLSVTLPFIAYIYMTGRSRVNTGVLIVAMASSMWMFVLTASRGGFMTILMSVVLTWWFVLKGSSRGRWVTVLIFLCFAVSIVKAPGAFWERVQTIWSDSSYSSNETAASAEESTKGRVMLLQMSLLVTLQNPVLGVGVGNFSVYTGYNRMGPLAWYGTHNSFTQLSAEAGIPALLLFLWMLYSMYRHSRDLSRQFAGDKENADLWLLSRAATVSVIALTFNGFFAHIAYDYLFYYVAGITAAMYAVGRHLKPPEEPAPDVSPFHKQQAPRPAQLPPNSNQVRPPWR